MLQAPTSNDICCFRHSPGSTVHTHCADFSAIPKVPAVRAGAQIFEVQRYRLSMDTRQRLVEGALCSPSR
jgi:hypothetical protein